MQVVTANAGNNCISFYFYNSLQINISYPTDQYLDPFGSNLDILIPKMFFLSLAIKRAALSLKCSMAYSFIYRVVLEQLVSQEFKIQHSYSGIVIVRWVACS